MERRADMEQSMMIDKYIDFVNELLDEQDIKQIALSKATGIDKNSLGLYLRKERNISFNAALKIANYLNLDISKVCGIKTDQVLSVNETKLIKEIRSTPEYLQEPTILSLLDIVKLINSNK